MAGIGTSSKLKPASGLALTRAFMLLTSTGISHLLALLEVASSQRMGTGFLAIGMDGLVICCHDRLGPAFESFRLPRRVADLVFVTQLISFERLIANP
jgi:hypothetical protein